MTIVRIDEMSLTDVKKCQERLHSVLDGFKLPNSSRIYVEMHKWSEDEIYSTISYIMRANDLISSEILKNQQNRLGMSLSYDVFLRAFRRQYIYTIDCLSERARFLEIRRKSRQLLEQLPLYPDSLIGGTDVNDE